MFAVDLYALTTRFSMPFPPNPTRVYIETYGCQMNVADSEVVGGILQKEGYAFTNDPSEADVVLVNTCAVRDNAEQRIYGRLGYLRTFKRRNPEMIVGILGCMAERLRERFVDRERLVDIVVGPDEYRKLPMLVAQASEGTKGIAVRLSRAENYDDITPLRTDGVSAWVSVMRGCDKFCTFCVVPFTRGRERSRVLSGVVTEVAGLVERGFREVTLLGQNVNAYRDGDSDFADLLRSVAAVDPSLRVRFTTSHPYDMSDRLIDAIASTENICNHIHLPVQSGSDRILALMNRTYTVAEYLALVAKIRRAIRSVSLSTDIISGFPTETEEDHQMTMKLMEEVGFDGAFTFKYSPREHTKAWDMTDDVPEDLKGSRVSEVTQLQHEVAHRRNAMMIGTEETILIEGPSKRSTESVMGRTDTNKTVVVPWSDEQPGDYITVRIERASSATLFGKRVRSASERASA
jgi:tRNA-2-methylthio-N6-dimethylallyladenosine synthase